MEAFDARTMQCAGPAASTCALSLGNRCALHDGADVIVYDESSVTPELREQLQRLPPDSPIVFASSERDADGHAIPVATRIRSDT